MQPPSTWSRGVFDALTREIWDLRVAVLGEERAHARSTEAGSRSPVERY
jgi:beta-N-acetylhexosaminidase